MRNVFFVAAGLMVLGALAVACAPCPPCPELPEQTQVTCPPCPELPEQPPVTCTAVCCGETGGIKLDYQSLPFPTGTLPPLFTFEDVVFTRIWDEIAFNGDALECLGSEEFPPGTWNDATVRLDFGSLSCGVCSIVAECAAHGPEARLEAYMLGGGTQVAVCPDDRGTVSLTTSADAPFMWTLLTGQEAEWFAMSLE
jgi:hypothetical protein